MTSRRADNGMKMAPAVVLATLTGAVFFERASARQQNAVLLKHISFIGQPRHELQERIQGNRDFALASDKSGV